MCNFSRLLVGLILLLSGYQAVAQSVANSPYSRLGIGDLNSTTSSIRSLAMGGVGVASPNSAMINDLNPALLFYNNFVTFETGISGETKRISNPNQQHSSTDANLGYLALSVPLTNRWAAAIGLRPFSNVDYQTYSIENVQNNANVQVTKTYEGEGGLSEAYFAHGVKIFKGLSAGVQGSFLFGTINNDIGTVLRDTARLGLGAERTGTVFSTRTTYSGFKFNGGLHYRHSIKERLFLSLGGTYGLGSDINATRRTLLQRRNMLVNELPAEETVIADSIAGKIHLPGFISIGLGLDNGKNWGIGLDFSSHQLSQFRSFEGRQDLQDAYRIGLGGEFTPDMMSLESYLRRITYRAGFSYARTPWITNGNPVNDMAISWGASLPVGRMSAIQRSFLNMGFAVGTRGNLNDNPIREMYFRFQAGLTLNNRWFIRRMID
jgi:hypothetical protein